MELLTDILAILGVLLLGNVIPSLVEIGSGQKVSSKDLRYIAMFSFGLIAASLVLG